MRKLAGTIELLGSGEVKTNLYNTGFFKSGGTLDASSAIDYGSIEFNHECDMISVLNDSAKPLFIKFYLGSVLNGMQKVLANSGWSGDRSFDNIKIKVDAIGSTEGIYITGKA